MPAITTAQVERAREIINQWYAQATARGVKPLPAGDFNPLADVFSSALADEAERATTRERERIIKAGDMWTASAWTSSDLDKAWARFTATIRARAETAERERDALLAERGLPSVVRSDVESLRTTVAEEVTVLQKQLATERAALADSRAMGAEKDAAMTEFFDAEESRPGDDANIKDLHDWFARQEDARDHLRRALALTPDSVRAQRKGERKVIKVAQEVVNECTDWNPYIKRLRDALAALRVEPA